MKKRIFKVTKWDKWQARSDKALPWMKLWGSLFKEPWFHQFSPQNKFATIAILDLARQFSNQIDSEIILKSYFRSVYGCESMSDKDVIELLKSLEDNDFLSDNCLTDVRLEGDKIRIDKIREEKKEEKRPTANPASFLESLKSNEAYKHVNFDAEFGKMDAWLSLPKNKNRKKTPQFILNWLNKIEAPVKTQKTYTPPPKDETVSQMEKWKKEAAPMPEDCKKQLEKFGIRSAV